MKKTCHGNIIVNNPWPTNHENTDDELDINDDKIAEKNNKDTGIIRVRQGWM